MRSKETVFVLYEFKQKHNNSNKSNKLNECIPQALGHVALAWTDLNPVLRIDFEKATNI